MSHGPAILAVLAEAKKHFGTITPANCAHVARWVQRRMRELTGQTAEIVPFEPKGFDAKQRQAGNDD